jgi:hypothetical protein
MNKGKRFPKKCVVDTNVPKTANRAIMPATIPDEEVHCVQACVEAIEHIVTKGGLVIDAGDCIFEEYRRQLSISGHPGLGDGFMKWVHDNRWKLPEEDRVIISKEGDTYLEFPNDAALSNFDRSDRKFVAVANKHPAKPPILEATDSKWWIHQAALEEAGIKVLFLCPDYVRRKCEEKRR